MPDPITEKRRKLAKEKRDLRRAEWLKRRENLGQWMGASWRAMQALDDLDRIDKQYPGMMVILFLLFTAATFAAEVPPPLPVPEAIQRRTLEHLRATMQPSRMLPPTMESQTDRLPLRLSTNLLLLGSNSVTFAVYVEGAASTNGPWVVIGAQEFADRSTNGAPRWIRSRIEPVHVSLLK